MGEPAEQGVWLRILFLSPRLVTDDATDCFSDTPKYDQTNKGAPLEHFPRLSLLRRPPWL
jgi:hypothetical protein